MKKVNMVGELPRGITCTLFAKMAFPKAKGTVATNGSVLNAQFGMKTKRFKPLLKQGY
ncbi:hypothetical protein [Thiocapsa rosea]|uniref:hypothetical protein n=1 Tax=Thiocapsa rosea TaxID=69360 RepID=UPI0014743558|nr:hypothetical protein [Thiocapsa rosea]